MKIKATIRVASCDFFLFNSTGSYLSKYINVHIGHFTILAIQVPHIKGNLEAKMTLTLAIDLDIELS